MQPVDFTTLSAINSHLQKQWLPARCEQVYQRDQYTLFIALRTIEKRGWLAISWHPQAARLHMAAPPPKKPDTFTFSQQLKHQLGGLALINIKPLSPWERALDLQFARRPNEPPLWHLYVEIMGKYSNVILTTADQQIVTAAHQVSEQQSSVRPIQTGRTYVHPPKIKGTLPKLEEDIDTWRDRVALIPGKLKKMLVNAHSGVSSSVASQLILAANLPADTSTDDLSNADWEQLFENWKTWLIRLETKTFTPGWIHTASTARSAVPATVPTNRTEHPLKIAQPKTVSTRPAPKIPSGYTVLGIGIVKPVQNVQVLLDEYYRHQFNQEEFRRLHNRIAQRLKNQLGKLRQKANTFSKRLQQSDTAEDYRQKADLLMANLHQWTVGSNRIELNDFETGEPVTLKLNPEKNAVQNAQALYKQHQKLKRARIAVMPLLAAVNTEIDYLEQVEETLLQAPVYEGEADLRSLEEARSELITQGYLRDTTGYQQASSSASPAAGKQAGKQRRQQPKKQAGRHRDKEPVNYRSYITPQGLEILIGRNNSQNEQLTFKRASDYDLWFHAQEIPGSHVLLRLNAGEVPDDDTLSLAANLTAYYSRARQSEQVPVVYTKPRHVYKPKGALPGMVIYKQEQILWGQPQQAQAFINAAETEAATTEAASHAKKAN
ncbi:MAG: NFACT RNA binding domain-containing protein [Cyanobacteria bacterium J06649_5]